MKTKDRRLSSKRIAYIIGRVPAACLEMAMQLARWYPLIHIHRDERNNLVFDGYLEGIRHPGYRESFWLSVETPTADQGPIETIWGTF